MHESVFSYNISRPYPYRWFTWVVIFGGIAATALFSVINLAADGYNLVTVFSPDPNATIAATQWFQNKPWSLTSKLSTSCQPQEIAATSQITTNNGGLTYTLFEVLKIGSAFWNFQPGLTYFNNALEVCNISGITMNWSNGTFQSPPSDDSMSAEATISCLFPDLEIGTEIGLQTSFLISQLGSYPLSSNQLTPAFDANGQNTFWARTLLLYYNAFWITSLASSKTDHYRGMKQLSVDVYQKAYVDDILSPNFFDWGSTISYENGTVEIYGGLTDQEIDVVVHARNLYLKIVWSAILTDLGQPSATNLFAQPSALAKFVTEYNVSQYISASTSIFPHAPPPGMNIRTFYQNQGTPLPTVVPTVISTRYLCQVPRLKSTASLIVSILVADLVFLQVLWKAFNWVVTSALERRHPDAKHCEGCGKDLHTNYSPINQSDSTVQAEAGNRPSAEFVEDVRSNVSVESRIGSATEEETERDPLALPAPPASAAPRANT